MSAPHRINIVIQAENGETLATDSCSSWRQARESLSYFQQHLGKMNDKPSWKVEWDYEGVGGKAGWTVFRKRGEKTVRDSTHKTKDSASARCLELNLPFIIS